MIIAVSFCFGVTIQAKCNKRMTGDSVIFLNTNATYHEVLAAEKGACSRGEKLVIIPENYKTFVKKFDEYKKVNRRINNCINNNGGNTSQCRQHMARQTELDLEISKLKDGLSIKGDLDRKLQELSSEGSKVKSLLISGHNGGGAFSGHIGAINRLDIDRIMKKHPDQAEAIRSIFLLGCYTGTHGEMVNWRGTLPSARIVAGYSGIAPADDKLAGHTYIEDILRKESDLIAEADEEKLKREVSRGIRHIRMMDASLFVDTTIECSEEGGEYLYQPHSKERFRPFAENGCREAFNKLSSMVEEQNKYFYGELPIPENTRSGEIRALYAFSRKNEHCFSRGENENENSAYIEDSPGLFMNGGLLRPDNLLMLLFYKDVAENFARYYEKDLKEIEKEIESFSVTDREIARVNENFDAFKARMEQSLRDIDLYKESPEKLVKNVADNIEKLVKQEEELLQLSDTYRSFISENEWALSGLGMLPPGELSPEDMELYRKHKKLRESQVVEGLRIESAKSGRRDYIDEGLKKNEEARKKALERLTESYNGFKNEFWVPTPENVKGKTRKQILENIHAYEKHIAALPAEAGDKLRRLGYPMKTMLENVSCVPFDWHETTATSHHDRPTCYANMSESPMYLPTFSGNYDAGDSEYIDGGGGSYSGGF